MKKMLPLLLTLSLTVLLALTACGGNDEDTQVKLPELGSSSESASAPETASESKSADDTEAESTPESADESTDESAEGTAETEPATETETETETSTEVIEETETVLYGEETLGECDEITLEADELVGGSLFDATRGQMTVGTLIYLKDVRNETSMGLIDETARFSKEAAGALTELCNAIYKETGMRVVIRTATHIKDASTVGYADYRTYRSVRITYMEEGLTYQMTDAKMKPVCDFLAKNAHRYGFIDLSAYKDEGHFRYVGVPHASIMHDMGFTLSDYHTYLADYSAERALSVTLDSTTYLITSTPVTDNRAVLAIPAGYGVFSTVSATGRGTIILTVKMSTGDFAYALPFATDPTANRAGKVIILDAGHGQKDPGAIFPVGSHMPLLCEKDVNLRVTLLAKKYLEAMGYTVLLTREDDNAMLGEGGLNWDYSTSDEVNKRVSFALSQNPALFVTIHCNSSENEKASGPLVYYNAIVDEANALCPEYMNVSMANALNDALNAALAPFVSAGTSQSSRLVECPIPSSSIPYPHAALRQPKLPALLLEMGFITNEADRALMTEAMWCETIAYAIAMATDELFASNKLN